MYRPVHVAHDNFPIIRRPIQGCHFIDIFLGYSEDSCYFQLTKEQLNWGKTHNSITQNLSSAVCCQQYCQLYVLFWK